MIEIFLNNHRVIQKPSQQIKFTAENPYITGSGSYTLEITFPLSIWENKIFFGSIDRVEVSKSPMHYEAKILSSNKEVFFGTATLSTITHEEVRIQFLGGNSEINFLHKYEDVYIDEIDFQNVNMYKVMSDIGAGQNTAKGLQGIWWKLFSYDSTNSVFLNGVDYGDFTVLDTAISPGFLFSLHMIIEGMGFAVSQDEYLATPIKKLYVMSGARVNPEAWNLQDVLTETLPHWSFQEYITQIQNLLNATVYFDERNRKARIIRNDSTTREICKIDVFDEYSEEIDEEKTENTIATRNLKYANNGEVEASSTLRWEETIHDLFEHKLFNNPNEIRDFVRANGEEAEKYILCCPEGTAVYVYDDNNISYQDFFGMQYRGAKEDFEFKVCPPITKSIEFPSGALTIAPFVKGPEAMIAGKNVMVRHKVFGTEEDYSSAVKKEDAKSDEMLLETDGEDIAYAFIMSLHVSGNTNQPANPWSFTIGDLHKNPIKIKDKVLHKYEFISNSIPDVNKLFLIRNKKFIPKKIEFTMEDKGINEKMTGYFYEMES